MKFFDKYKLDKTKLINPFSLTAVKNFCKSLVTFKGKPSKIALSLAVGIFIGIFMPVGFQVIFVIPLTIMLDLNLIVSATATFITNPLTVLPLYYLIIRLGEFLTQKNISWAKIESLINSPSIDNFLHLGYESLIVFFSGSLLLAIVTSISIYYITLKLIIRHRKKLEAN